MSDVKSRQPKKKTAKSKARPGSTAEFLVSILAHTEMLIDEQQGKGSTRARTSIHEDTEKTVTPASEEQTWPREIPTLLRGGVRLKGEEDCESSGHGTNKIKQAEGVESQASRAPEWVEPRQYSAIARKAERQRQLAMQAGYAQSMPDLPPSSIAVADAKGMAPPGASLWQDDEYGSWQGHYHPYPRRGRSWRTHGEPQALRLVLHYLWKLYLFEQGWGAEQCLVKRCVF